MRLQNSILSAAILLTAAATLATNAFAGSSKGHLLLIGASGYSNGGDFGTVIGPRANIAKRGDLVSLNPQPLPPGGEISLNPQPLPPKARRLILR